MAKENFLTIGFPIILQSRELPISGGSPQAAWPGTLESTPAPGESEDLLTFEA